MDINKAKIHKELDRMNWSYADLAEAMGVKRQWVYYKLRYNTKGTTFKTVETFAKALDLDPKDLIT